MVGTGQGAKVVESHGKTLSSRWTCQVHVRPNPLQPILAVPEHCSPHDDVCQLPAARCQVRPSQEPSQEVRPNHDKRSKPVRVAKRHISAAQNLHACPRLRCTSKGRMQVLTDSFGLAALVLNHLHVRHIAERRFCLVLQTPPHNLPIVATPHLSIFPPEDD